MLDAGTEYELEEYTCSDGEDNDDNGETDCQQSNCMACSVCGNAESECALGCPYEIVLTDAADAITDGSALLLDCPIYK